jgi:AcrR family transcriptional regulator
METATAYDERGALIDAGLAVLRDRGGEGCTVVDILAEAGLSTRAFYRHFASKDELVLAIFERDAQANEARLRDRMDAAPSPKAAVEVWIDEILALAFSSRRSRRTRPLAKEGLRLRARFPREFAAIVRGIVEPLTEALRRIPSAAPERDARSMYAVTWELVADKLAGGKLTREEAREHAVRFCLGAVGLTP